MNIWIVNHYATPPSLGTWTRHYNFAKYLRQWGHTVTTFAASAIHNTDINLISDKRLYIHQEIDDIDYVHIRSRSYVGNGKDRILGMLEFARRFMHVARCYPLPDIIYVSTPHLLAADAALRFARRNKIPCVIEVRDLWPETYVALTGASRNHPVVLCMAWLERRLYRYASRIVFTMQGGRDYVAEHRFPHVDINKIFHINNGVDLETCDQGKYTYTINDPDLLDRDTFKIVYAGAIRLANGIAELVAVAKILAQTNPRIRFLLYGDGTDRERIEKLIISEGLQNIKCKGFVHKSYIPFILSHSDLNLGFYATKIGDLFRYGSSHNKLFDYFASGKPVIMNVRAKYDLVEEYNAGISLDKATPQRLADAIVHFSQMPKDEYDGYCQRARQAATEYDFKKLSRKLLDVLEGALS